MDTLVNRVANSGLITLNLELYFPKAEMVIFDIKDYLFKELILKEKDFRSALKELDWTTYEGKIVIITCSTDAIIPMWAYMLISTYAKPYAADIYIGTQESYLNHYYDRVIADMDMNTYDGQRIVIKGCSNKPVPPGAYAGLAAALQPYAQSIMFGEPCSTVPIFKRPRKITK